jgi:glycosyltransferase involved in cell wall biosynthesis
LTTTCLALLGRKDVPTDAVEEYCRYLGDALVAHDYQLQIRRVPWELHGWRQSLRALRLQSVGWRGTWVLVQYTALAWSARGFPLKFPRVLRILKSAGARVAVVFHDVEPFSSPRLIDRLRHHVQRRAMRRALHLADLAVFTVPLYKLSWLPFVPANAVYTDPTVSANRKLSPKTMESVERILPPESSEQLMAGNNAADNLSPLMLRSHFIPVGPNLPIPEHWQTPLLRKDIPNVGVFSITGGQQGAIETRKILAAVQHAAKTVGKLHLSVFGRHAELRREILCKGLENYPVELSVEGVLDDRQIIDRIRGCDVLLFVRGGISTRRSSAIAGISCAVPMVAFVGPETSWPFLDAGVILVSASDPGELNDALVRLLANPELRADLSSVNQLTYNEHFAWSVIAGRYAALLNSR